MKRVALLCALPAAVVLILACGEDRTVEPQMSESTVDTEATVDNAQAIARELVTRAGWPIEEQDGSAAGDLSRLHHVCGFEREVIADDIVHYSFELRVGPGPYDVIGIHRVVKERRPYRPIRTSKNIFFQHGCCKDFVGVYLPGLTSPSTSNDFGIAVYLARNGVDVWGIDQAWTLVPEEESNFDFMADWGVERQMSDLRVAVTVARFTRLMTGSGPARINLSGYSNGVVSSLALVDLETQLPPGLRQVGGYIPIDMPIKVGDPALWEALSGIVEFFYRPLYESGEYAEPNSFPAIAELVRCCPDDPSPFDPSVTNLEFALIFSAAAGLGDASSFHYWAGILNDDGMPTALRYTDTEMWLDFLASGVPYEPMVWGLAWISYVIDELDTPYDDHLAEIEVPILNVTPAGGFADQTLYGLTLLGSSDIQTLMPGTGVPVLEEYAHIDIFTYEGSEQLVWQPMLAWIESHSSP